MGTLFLLNLITAVVYKAHSDSVTSVTSTTSVTSVAPVAPVTPVTPVTGPLRFRRCAYRAAQARAAFIALRGVPAARSAGFGWPEARRPHAGWPAHHTAPHVTVHVVQQPYRSCPVQVIASRNPPRECYVRLDQPPRGRHVAATWPPRDHCITAMRPPRGVAGLRRAQPLQGDRLHL